MMRIAWKNLLAEKARFGVPVVGVALSVFLIAFFLSLFRGFSDEIDDYIESVPADLWVAQQGTRDFLGVSILSATTAETIQRELGPSAKVDSLLSRPTDIIFDGEPVSVHIIGYETDGGIGGPQETDGKSAPGPGEIIIDKVLSQLEGIDIGDTVTIGQQPFDVVGLSSGGNFVFTQLAFLPIEEARATLGMEGITNFILVRLEDPAQTAAAQTAIRQSAPFVQAFPREEFVDTTRTELTRALVPLLAAVVVVGFIVGCAVVGLTIYTLTVERMREYGILKAVGHTNLDLFQIVVAQSLMASVIGFGVGVVLVLAAGRLMQLWLPQYATVLVLTDLVAVFGATMVMAILASFVPIRKLASLDPVIVFNP